MNIIAVLIGGSIGALLRYIIVSYLNVSAIPIGTLVVNLLAALAVGICYVLVIEHWQLPILKNFLIIGMLGAFSTLSALSIETWIMISKETWLMAATYVLATNIGVLLITGAAIFITRYCLNIN